MSVSEHPAVSFDCGLANVSSHTLQAIYSAVAAFKSGWIRVILMIVQSVELDYPGALKRSKDSGPFNVESAS